MTIKKLLIANRGEIACRVIRTAKELGIITVAVYSEADKYAPHVKFADESVLVGPPAPVDSYLSIDRICQAVETSGADAVHPGYGFLSENPDFAKQLQDRGITFVGPSVDAIEQMGNKASAKRLMLDAGVPCIPGYEDSDQSDASFTSAADSIGFPVMVKAAAGGGGRGMRLVSEPGQLTDALSLARAEADSAFSNSELILEKAIIAPRHVEVQILADNFGRCIHLGERDCSVQRRHQKVIEEAPCAVITNELREKMGAAAITAAKSVNYTGAGTVEFLLDSKEQFYFLEMNTRLQVEHPVTEMITGIDLVAMQLQIAMGQPLAIAQEDVRFDGHAIEVRLCAENPSKDFIPTTGTIHRWQPAQIDGVRFDSGIETGSEVTPWYDSMLAKVIAHGESREQARQRLCKALANTTLAGLTTNQQFLHSALTVDSFIAAEATTAFISDTWPNGYTSPAPDVQIQATAAALSCHYDLAESLQKSHSTIHPSLIGWSSANPLTLPVELLTEHGLITATVHANPGGNKWNVTINSPLPAEDPSIPANSHQCAVEFVSLHEICSKVMVNDHSFTVNTVCKRSGDTTHIWLSQGPACWLFSRTIVKDSNVDVTGSGNVTAPMPGQLLELLVTEGQIVEKGQPLAVLEAMKMQHQIIAEADGTVKRIAASQNAQVRSGDLLIEIE